MTNLSALEAFIRTNPDARELKRALAVKMTLSQYTHGQIESLLGVTSGFISKWKHRYLAEGVETLRLAHRGSAPFLSVAQRQQVIEYFRWLNSDRDALRSETARRQSGRRLDWSRLPWWEYR